MTNFRKDHEYKKHRKMVTHVAIVYGRGYEHLNYNPGGNKNAYTVLPINAPVETPKN